MSALMRAGRRGPRLPRFARLTLSRRFAPPRQSEPSQTPRIRPVLWPSPRPHACAVRHCQRSTWAVPRMVDAQAVTCCRSAAAMAVICRKIGASPWLGSNSAGLPLALVRQSIYPVGKLQQAILCSSDARRRLIRIKASRNSRAY